MCCFFICVCVCLCLHMNVATRRQPKVSFLRHHLPSFFFRTTVSHWPGPYRKGTLSSQQGRWTCLSLSPWGSNYKHKPLCPDNHRDSRYELRFSRFTRQTLTVSASFFFFLVRLFVLFEVKSKNVTEPCTWAWTTLRCILLIQITTWDSDQLLTGC